MNNRIEYLVEEFFNKFFPDLADKVHQEQSDWLRYAIITIAEEARREERERIQKSFDHWFKKGTEDVEDWAERVLTTANNK